MFSKRRTFLLALTASLSSACTSPLPIPVAEPSSECLNDSSLKACRNPTDGLSTFDSVIRAFRAYAITWSSESTKKRQQALATSEVSFYGALVGAIGGIVQSPPTAIAGASLAAGSSIYSQRYRLEVQAANYDLAAASMQCMYDYTSPLLGTPSSAATIEARDIALENLHRVRDKFRSLQNSFELGKPDVGGIVSGIKTRDKDIQAFREAGEVDVGAARLKGLSGALSVCVAKMNG